MGRPSKNPEHPLVRLRKVLSTPHQEMTRELFSKKVGIPAPSLKAIETGKYGLTPDVAAQIAAVTNVDPKCLMDPNLPLTDPLGDLFLKGQRPLAAYLKDEYKDIKALFDAAIDAAEEKQKQVFFSFLFLQWFEKMSKILGLRSAITHKLLEEYPLQCFEAIPKHLWPKEREWREELDKQIKKFQDELGVRFSSEFGGALKNKALKNRALKNQFREILSSLLPDLEPLMNQVEKAQPGAARKKALLQYLRTLVIPFQDVLEDEGLSLRQLLWDLRRKMIEEAKASKPV